MFYQKNSSQNDNLCMLRYFILLCREERDKSKSQILLLSTFCYPFLFFRFFFSFFTQINFDHSWTVGLTKICAHVMNFQKIGESSTLTDGAVYWVPPSNPIHFNHKKFRISTLVLQKENS